MDMMLGMAMSQSLIKVAPFPLNHGLSELKSLAKTAATVHHHLVKLHYKNQNKHVPKHILATLSKVPDSAH